MTTDQIPHLATIDCLIIGGSAAAVGAALSAKAKGLSVQVIAPRPYLGDDICARFAYWPTEGATGDLATALFPHAGRRDATPPTPMHIKRTLEQRLVAAGIPFLLNCHPAGVLRQDDGTLAGIVIANRRGRQAIAAGTVIDATADAQVCRQAGIGFTASRTGTVSATHVTIGGTIAEGVDHEVLPPMIAEGRKGPIELAARRYRLDVDLGDASWPARCRAQAEIERRCWAPDLWQQGEVLDIPRLDRVAGDERVTSWTSAADFPIDTLQVAKGLHLLGSTAPVADTVAEFLHEPLQLLAIGERLGATIASGTPTGLLQADCAGSTMIASGTVGTALNGLRPGDEAEQTLPATANTLPVVGSYDVVVIGGGTGGAPAGIAAGRAGATTLLCEHLCVLGGVTTAGQIANYWFGNRVGFTAEMDAGVKAFETEELKEGRWTPAAKAAWLHQANHAANVTIAYGTTCCGTWVVDGQVRGVVLVGPMGYGLVEAKAVVDATGCADVAAAAGADVTGISSEHVAVQGTGLAGVSPEKRYNNSDHSFSDDTDVADATSFLVAAKEKFKDHFDAGQLIDSRERQQIIGDMSLSPVDFLCDRRFPDTICISSSNFDTHGFVVHPLFLVKPMSKTRMWVHVPYRCLLPRGIDGVLVTGLGLSAHRDALPVVRMQPDVQNHGYAAGYAAAMAAADDIGVRAIDVSALQQHLIAIGNLPDSVLSDSDNFPVNDHRLERAVHDAWQTHAGIALCFAEPTRSPALLRAALADASEPDQRRTYAQILALLGDASGVDKLRQLVSEADWDAGWNYKGMGQFGMSTSWVDGLLIALATVDDARAWPVLRDKIQALTSADDLPDFSHCRAVAIAAERLSQRHDEPAVAADLAALLAKPGLAGHVQTSQQAVQDALTDKQNEDSVRNNALRELHLARALYRCGDQDGVGARLLADYAKDLRGHFARHASAVLAETNRIPQPM